MGRRRSWFSLKGKVGIRGQRRGAVLPHPAFSTNQPADPCTTAVRRYRPPPLTPKQSPARRGRKPSGCAGSLVYHATEAVDVLAIGLTRIPQMCTLSGEALGRFRFIIQGRAPLSRAPALQS